MPDPFERFYFIDMNYPEVLYFGDQGNFDAIRDAGGNPRNWGGETAPIGGFVTVACKGGGVLTLEVVAGYL